MNANGKLVCRRRSSELTRPSRSSSTSLATTTTNFRGHSSYNVNKYSNGQTSHQVSHTQMSRNYENPNSGSRGKYKEEVYKNSFKQVSNNGGGYMKSYQVEVKVTEKLYRKSRG